jgi:acetyl esterase/lipase
MRLRHLPLLFLAALPAARAELTLPLHPELRALGDPQLLVHRAPADQATGAALVIFPGGGYGGLVMGYEGRDFARWCNEQGLTACIATYRVAPHRHPSPYEDGRRAVRLARAHAAEWKVDPTKIGVIGFSAGGHLAATVATRFDAGDPQASDPVERQSSRPDFQILIYPVISMGPYGHPGSRRNLLGPTPDPALVDWLSNEKHVTARTSPAFLLHPVRDTVVPVINSRLYADALRAHAVPVELRELPAGGHGLGGGKGEAWAAMQEAVLAWLRGRGLAKPPPPAAEESPAPEPAP